MTRSRTIAFLDGAAVIPVTALAVAGYGGGNDATGSTAPPRGTGDEQFTALDEAAL